MIMELLLNFIIKNIEGYTDRKIQKDYPEYLPFIDVLRDILKILNSNITLDKIAVISAIKGLFTYDDVRKTVKEIVALHLLEFTITKRDLVNGPNLMLKELIPPTAEEVSSKDMQMGYLKPKIEPGSTLQPEPTHEPAPTQAPAPELMPEPISDIKSLEPEFMKEKIEDLGTIGGKRDEIAGELQFSEMEKVKTAKNEMADAKEAMDRMEEMLRKPSVEDQLFKAKKSQEKERILSPPDSVPPAPGSAPPPGSPPSSPLKLRSGMKQELKELFSKTMDEKKIEPPSSPPAPGSPTSGSAPPAPGSPPKSAPKRQRALLESRPPPSPSPSPSEPSVTSAGVPPPSFKAKRKSKKKMGARLRSFDNEAEDAAPILDEGPLDKAIVAGIKEEVEEREKVEEIEEEMLDDFAETSAPMELPPPLKSAILPELAEVAKEMESSKEYQKNIAIEYFDKMNPKKYYPLIIDITDIEQATTISEENILTGERKVQVKEKMAVVLKSSIVKVKPMFPGCSIVPEERYTDLDKKEDKLTFYVTPLVDDEIEDGRVEFIDSEGNIFHSAPTPSKVEDPRYARMIALYGGLASFLPKILETLGFNFVSNLKMATLIPFMHSVFGDLNLSNFIGISGIIITIIICIITVVVRKPNSVKKKFKVARVGRLKSAIKVRK